ncbi:MAG: rhodanese-like domain-containing protein [Candidatus Binataceae bacterium]|jgi:rhodanese-related sulfurtransferase
MSSEMHIQWRGLIGLIAAIVMLSVPFAAPAFAADIGSVINNTPTASTNIHIIHVKDLANLIADPNAHVRIYDANVPTVREGDGMIPAARPLSSSGDYNVADELPSNHNAKLVFYCKNLQCGASDEAARRAAAAGYTDASEMKDGIEGWRAAGEPVQMPNGNIVRAATPPSGS